MKSSMSRNVGAGNDGLRQAEEIHIPFRRFGKFGNETISKVEHQSPRFIGKESGQLPILWTCLRPTILHQHHHYSYSCMGRPDLFSPLFQHFEAAGGPH